MKYYGVVFSGTPYKEYLYKAEKELPIGAICKIVADDTTAYKNSVKIGREISAQEAGRLIARTGMHIRMITDCRVIRGAARPDDRIDKVYYNKEKGTTCVLWDDGTKTVIKCQPGDTWDEEKALALCYMKRVLGNRGSFNETLKKYCWEEEK